jgi:hypothetical protein
LPCHPENDIQTQKTVQILLQVAHQFPAIFVSSHKVCVQVLVNTVYIFSQSNTSSLHPHFTELVQLLILKYSKEDLGNTITLERILHELFDIYDGKS